MTKRLGWVVWGVAGCGVATAIGAATALAPQGPVNISRSAEATEKAKMVRLSYAAGGAFRKAWVVTYADGAEGRQNVYVRWSFDDGGQWSAPLLLSRDAAGAPTGGAAFTARDGLGFTADNDKPSIFGATGAAGPALVVTWNSAYCPPDPRAGAAGGYANPGQGVGDFDGDGRPDRPFHCLWVATSTDPALTTWQVQALTTGARDAIGEVVAGNATGTAFALAWQEDPAGLQPGEAEGRGDGGMGSHVSGGTNIWYTHAPAADSATLLTNVAQLSDNETPGTGQPGASRPNLQISGATAVVVYEESSCAGGSSGKCIVHHAFPYAGHETHAAGTVLSDPARNARRARIVLQGAAAAGTSPLRTVLLWRESVAGVSAAPADLMLRRGLAEPATRPGSTGFAPADLLAEPAQQLTDVARSGGNINAHRAIVRGDFVGLAYDLTPDMNGADPEHTAVPTANYNLRFSRSLAGGAAGLWSTPVDLSRLASPALTVVEPRLVPTPGTVVNPLTGMADPGDTQNGDVFYVAYGVETNTLVGQAERIRVARSVDRGASFEPFVPVSPRTQGQSEVQLRPLPDGSSATALWMEEQSAGDPASKEAMWAQLTAVPLPDLQVALADQAFAAGAPRTLNVMVANRGSGAAHEVVLAGTLPAGLRVVGLGHPGWCDVQDTGFRCRLPSLAAGLPEAFPVTLAAAEPGDYVVSLAVSSADLDAESADNATTTRMTATAAETPPPTPPAQPDPAQVHLAGGGGCSLAPPGSGSGSDPLLPALLGLALAAVTRRRRAQKR